MKKATMKWDTLNFESIQIILLRFLSCQQEICAQKPGIWELLNIFRLYACSFLSMIFFFKLNDSQNEKIMKVW